MALINTRQHFAVSWVVTGLKTLVNILLIINKAIIYKSDLSASMLYDFENAHTGYIGLSVRVSALFGHQKPLNFLKSVL